jgi:ribosomal-protein-alanine N-acetyltransferase
MYERYGFRAAGHRRRYYHDNGEDALIMWLEPEKMPATSAASRPGVSESA